MSPSSKIDLAAELRKRGMSQFRLSAATGIHPSMISNYARGRVEPSPANAARIAEALKLRKGES